MDGTSLVLAAAVWLFQPPAPAMAAPPPEPPPESTTAAPFIAPAPPVSTPAVLAGPHIADDTAGPPTLVKRDFNGRVIRTEDPPEEAALSLLALSADALAPARRVLDERLLLIDRFVTDNAAWLNEVETAFAAGSAADKLGMLNRIFDASAPLRVRGSLYNQLAAALPAPSLPEYNRILGEYWDALASEKKPAGRANWAESLGATIQGKAESLGREIERSFRRLLASGDFLFEYLTRDIGLTADQSARLHTMFNEFAERYGEEPPKDKAGRFAVAVLSWLTLGQQEKLIRRVQSLGA